MTVGVLIWWMRRRKRRTSALVAPFKKQEVAKKGAESPDDSSSDGGRPLEREGPLKTDVVPYSQYRQQRLDNIRGSVGLPGESLRLFMRRRELAAALGEGGKSRLARGGGATSCI